MNLKEFLANTYLLEKKDNIVDFYKTLPQTIKDEIINNIKSENIHILKTLRDNLNEDKHSGLIVALLIDFAKSLTKKDMKNSTNQEVLFDFLSDTYFYNRKITKEQKTEVVKAFIQSGINANVKSERKNPLIHFVALHCNFEAVKLLVCKKARLNLIDSDEDSVLSSSISKYENVDSFKYLLEQPDVEFVKGMNILYLALRNDFKEIQKIILNSNLLENQQFLKSCHNQCKADELNDFLIEYEKIKLEKLLETPIHSKIKIKI